MSGHFGDNYFGDRYLPALDTDVAYSAYSVLAPWPVTLAEPTANATVKLIAKVQSVWTR